MAARAIQPEVVMIAPGKYKVVIAAAEMRESRATEWLFNAITAVVIEGEYTGEVLYGFYTKNPQGEFAWRDAVEEVEDLTVGLKLWGEVRVEPDMEDQPRARLVRLHAIEPPRTIIRYGAVYRFERRT